MTYSATVTSGTSHDSTRAASQYDLIEAVNRVFDKAWNTAGKPGRPSSDEFLEVHTKLHFQGDLGPDEVRTITSTQGGVKVILRRM